MGTMVLQQRPQHVYVPPDEPDPDALDPSLFLPAWRPWLALYGARIRFGGHTTSDVQLAPIQAMLPEEVLVLVFSALPPHALAAAACVCMGWRTTAETPSLWRAACLKAFASTSLEANLHMLKKNHQGKWRNMFMDRPHLRFDGLYVSRNTYIKRGIVEWRVRNACHVVCYFRYCRFSPDGSLLYRTSPEVVSKVAKTMQNRPSRRHRRDEAVSEGRYYMDGDRLFTKWVYPSSSSSEVRTRLRLRSTTRGANNRLDILAITSYDHASNSSSDLSDSFGVGAREEDEDLGEARSHKRGLSPYVFVPWEQVNTSILNKSVEEMDLWIPG